MARKESKICLVCGNEFKGTYGKFTCNSTCRSALSRMVERGKKPEYWLIAQSKGQKMPSFQKKVKAIKQVEVKKIQTYEIMPEKILVPEPTKILTPQEKIGHNARIEIKIHSEKIKECPKNVHPKLFRMQQDDIISELEKQKL